MFIVQVTSSQSQDLLPASLKPVLSGKKWFSYSLLQPGAHALVFWTISPISSSELSCMLLGRLGIAAQAI